MFLKWWQLELHTVLQVWPEKHSAEWDDHVSVSASNVPVDAVQDPICLSSCSGALLTHVRSGQMDLS